MSIHIRPLLHGNNFDDFLVFGVVIIAAGLFFFFFLSDSGEEEEDSGQVEENNKDASSLDQQLALSHFQGFSN